MLSVQIVVDKNIDSNSFLRLGKQFNIPLWVAGGHAFILSVDRTQMRVAHL